MKEDREWREREAKGGRKGEAGGRRGVRVRNAILYIGLERLRSPPFPESSPESLYVCLSVCSAVTHRRGFPRGYFCRFLRGSRNIVGEEGRGK